MRNRYWSASRYLDYIREDHRAKLKVLGEMCFEPVEDGNYVLFERTVGEEKIYVHLHSKESTFALELDHSMRAKKQYTSPVRCDKGNVVLTTVAFIAYNPVSLHVHEDFVTAKLLAALLLTVYGEWQRSLDENPIESAVEEALQETEKTSCSGCGKEVCCDTDESYRIVGPNIDDRWLCADCFYADECPNCGRH